ncbi:MAG: flavin reductase [Fidelibacterota bacterium]|nr:MAG: flavin reductase [Candidatus Neomarinimicrobiota bacterium]
MDDKIKKQVLRRLDYGLYIATAASGQHTVATTVTWVSQVSFEPPLIMVAMRNEGHTLEVCRKAGAFALHVIGEHQKDMAAAFFKAPVVEGNTLSGYVFEPGDITRAPILEDPPAWIEAMVEDSFPVGDHTIIIGRVVGAGLRDPDVSPLTLSDTSWHYGG